MFPAFSQNQHNPNAVKSILHRAIVTSGFLVFPAMIGLTVISEPLVEFLLTDKWLGAVPFMQIFSIGCLLYPAHITNSTAINAMGRSDLTLKAETIKWVVALLLICITGFFGAIAIALGLVLVVVFATYLLTSINKRLISYGWKEQWKDMMPALVLALIMGLIIYPLQFLPLQPIGILIIQILCGVLIYFGLALCLRLEAFTYLRTTLKEMLQK